MPNVQKQLPERVIITTQDSQNMNPAHHSSRGSHNGSGRSPRMRILARVSSTSMRRFQSSNDRSPSGNESSSINSGHLLRSVPCRVPLQLSSDRSPTGNESSSINSGHLLRSVRVPLQLSSERSPSGNESSSINSGHLLRSLPCRVPLQLSSERSQSVNESSSINSGHLLRSVPIHSLDYYEFRGYNIPAYSTPISPVAISPHHEAFNSQIDYNLSWMPKDIHLSDMIDPNILRVRARKGGLPAKYLQQDPKILDNNSSEPDTLFLMEQYLQEPSSDFEMDSPFLLKQPLVIDPAQADFNKSSPKRESLIEWFDRTVEQELQKRRLGYSTFGENLLSFDEAHFPRSSTPKGPLPPPKELILNSLVLEAASTGNPEVDYLMRNQPQSELMEAVDSLAKAEAVCTFEGAVRAAEEAASMVPPELVEEAAAAGAQSFTAEITNTVKEQIPGVKPIEVVGYVGITRPKHPKKNNFQMS